MDYCMMSYIANILFGIICGLLIGMMVGKRQKKSNN